MAIGMNGGGFPRRPVPEGFQQREWVGPSKGRGLPGQAPSGPTGRIPRSGPIDPSRAQGVVNSGENLGIHPNRTAFHEAADRSHNFTMDSGGANITGRYAAGQQMIDRTNRVLAPVGVTTPQQQSNYDMADTARSGGYIPPLANRTQLSSFGRNLVAAQRAGVPNEAPDPYEKPAKPTVPEPGTERFGGSGPGGTLMTIGGPTVRGRLDSMRSDFVGLPKYTENNAYRASNGQGIDVTYDQNRKNLRFEGTRSDGLVSAGTGYVKTADGKGTMRDPALLKADGIAAQRKQERTDSRILRLAATNPQIKSSLPYMEANARLQAKMADAASPGEQRLRQKAIADQKHAHDMQRRDTIHKMRVAEMERKMASGYFTGGMSEIDRQEQMMNDSQGIPAQIAPQAPMGVIPQAGVIPQTRPPLTNPSVGPYGRPLDSGPRTQPTIPYGPARSFGRR